MKRLGIAAIFLPLLLLWASPAAALSASSVPTQFSIPWGSSAGGAYITYPVPTSSQIGIKNCAASLTDGFPPLTFTPVAAGGCAPFGQDFNGILKQITLWAQWQGAGGPIVYNSGQSAAIGGYPKGAALQTAASPQCFWISTVDNNSSDPDTGGSNWTNTCAAGGSLSGTWPNVSIVNSGVTAGTYSAPLNLTVGADGRVTAASNGGTPLPGGYLTPCQVSSGSPATGCAAGVLMPTADVTGVTNLFYEPAFGNGLPIYNGSAMANVAFSELTLAVPSSRVADTLYDVYVFLNSGTPTLAFGPAWSSSTLGSSARGSGAGTAQQATVAGIVVNASAVTAVNGSNSYTIPTNQGTYVGTCYIDGTNGQLSFYRTWGQSRKWACWNAYNQQKIVLKVGDSTSSWTYASATPRVSRGNSGNSMIVLTGLAQEEVEVSFQQTITVQENTSSGSAQIGVGVNATSFSGTTGNVIFNISGNPGTVVGGNGVASYTLPPSLGVNQLNALEATPQTAGTITFDGAEQYMLLKATYRG